MASPDYSRAEQTAYSLLERQKNPILPIDIFSLVKDFDDLRFMTYGQFAARHKLSLGEVIKLVESESGCCYYHADEKRFLVLYNDAIPSPGHIRWTLGHELGHYILGHNQLSEEACLSRGGIPSQKYNVFEKEANCFARCLLAPPNLIEALRLSTAREIEAVFDISPTAARNVLSFFKMSIGIGILYNPVCSLTTAFSGAVDRYMHRKKCERCGAEYRKLFPFCPVCGSENYKHAGGFTVKYSKIELDEQGRARVCPRCGNDETHHKGNYCPVCGSLIINRCVSKDAEIPSEYYCNMNGEPYLPGHMRYCPYCGDETTFSENKFLKSWSSDTAEPELVTYHQAVGGPPVHPKSTAGGRHFSPF